MTSLKQKIKTAIEIVLNSEILTDKKDEEFIILDKNYQKLLDRIADRVIDALKESDLERVRKSNIKDEEWIKAKWDKIKKA